MYDKHSKYADYPCVQMFSSVQPARSWLQRLEGWWQGRLISNTDAVCIRGLPDDTFATPPEALHHDSVLSRKAVKNFFDTPHERYFSEFRVSVQHLPLTEVFIEGWRRRLAEMTHQGMADEVVNYWQEQASLLNARNVRETGIFVDVCGCNHVDDETGKWIKGTVFTTVAPSIDISLPPAFRSSAEEVPD